MPRTPRPSNWGDVSLAFFHGCPFNPDERAICENWTFTVPQRRFGAPRFDDAIAQLAGPWRAIGYHNEHPVYVQDDVESAVYYNEYKEQWEVISIADEAIDLLARAKKKKEMVRRRRGTGGSWHASATT